MKVGAQQHLERARVAIRRSDAALMEAATEIRQALETDAQLTLADVGREIGRSADWVTALLRWAENHDDGEAMYSADRQARLCRATRQGLRELSDDDLRELVTQNGAVWKRLKDIEFADWRASYQYTPLEINRVERFRRYQLSRLDAWGVKYDWNQLSDEEKLELAPEIERKLEALVADVKAMLLEVGTAA